MLAKFLPTLALASSLCLIGCVDRSGIQSHAKPLTHESFTLSAHSSHIPLTAWPEQSWWHVYQDPQLNQLMAKALAKSPTLKVTHARILKAQAISGVIESQSHVQAELVGSVHRKQWPDDHFYGPGDLARSRTWDNTLHTGFRYALDFWDKIEKQTLKAHHSIALERAKAESACLELAVQLIEQYILLSQYYQQLEVSKQEIEHRKLLIRLADDRLSRGLGTHQEVNVAKLPLTALKRQKDLYEEGIALTQTKLAALAAIPLNQMQALGKPSLAISASVGLPAQLPLTLVAKRPDVQTALWQVKVQAADIEVREADFYPTVNLTAQLGAIATQGSLLGFLTQRKTFAHFGPDFSLPIFDGGQRRDALGLANAEYDVAVETYNQTLLNAFAELSQQLIRWHSLEEQSHFVAQALTPAQQHVEHAQLRFDLGLSDYQSVLKAQQEIFAQTHLAISIKSEQSTTQARLLTALGGGAVSHAEPLLSEPTP